MKAEPAFSPAADRNKQPILQVLQQVLPAQGSALEIASGTGQHVAWFAQHLPHWTWQPTDADAPALNSIDAHIAQAQLGKSGKKICCSCPEVKRSVLERAAHPSGGEWWRLRGVRPNRHATNVSS